MESDLELFKRWVQSRDARRAFQVHAGITGRVSQFQIWITTEQSTPAFNVWKKTNRVPPSPVEYYESQNFYTPDQVEK